jgi:hypothetical protein
MRFVPSLQRKFEELRLHLKQGRGLGLSGDDPVYYIVFPPREMLDLKRELKAWLVKLKHEGWDPHVFSMMEAVHTILRENDLRKIWEEAEAEDPLNFQEINETLSQALQEGDALKNRLLNKLKDLKSTEGAILFISDLEVLHPYLRIGALEQKLQGKFYVPTVVLYPGVRSGRTFLKFLGFYPEDGNYRSVHIG